MTDLFEKTSGSLKEKYGIYIEKDTSLSQKTTYKIGGPADIGIFPSTIGEFETSVLYCREHGIPFYVMGRGSNLLADDEGFRGAVIFTERMNSVRFEENRVFAMAGAGLTSLSRRAGSLGLAGFEFACGIPGSVGGAVAMNAGAYGGEICDVFTSCTVWREGVGIVECTLGDADFSYRHSAFLENRDFVLETVLTLERDDPDEIKSRENDLLSRRREKQPLEYPSAGSAFKRPEGYFAAKLIEDAGLKGFRIGDAEVSRKHSGFIVNAGNATSSDVIRLYAEVREKVKKLFGVTLESEVRYLSPKGEESI